MGRKPLYITTGKGVTDPLTGVFSVTDRHVNVSPGQESFVFARLNRKTPSLEETYPEGEKCTYGLTNQEAYVGGDKLQSIPTGGDVD